MCTTIVVTTSIILLKTKLGLKVNSKKLGTAFIINICCELISLTTVFLIANIFFVPLTPLLAISYIISKIVGIITIIPFGLFTQDITFGMYLLEFIDPKQIISFEILLRITTIIPSTIIGWIIATNKIKKLRENKKLPKNKLLPRDFL